MINNIFFLFQTQFILLGYDISLLKFKESNFKNLLSTMNNFHDGDINI